jgi:hypothetical protein
MGFRRRLRGALACMAFLTLASSMPAETRAATATKKSTAPRRSNATAARTNAACLGKAMGGMESIARISTIYTRYQFDAGALSGTLVTWRDVRGAVRESLDVPGAFSALTVFDGARGWRRGENGVVQSLAGADLADQVCDAYLGSFMHIVPGRISGTVERVGLDRATGLVKLRVTPQGGTVATLYVDTLTCLPARVTHATGTHAPTLYLGDWRTVSGVKIAHAIRRATGDSTSAKLTLLEARIDAPVPRGAFAKPMAVVPQPVTEGGK